MCFTTDTIPNEVIEGYLDYTGMSIVEGVNRATSELEGDFADATAYGWYYINKRLDVTTAFTLRTIHHYIDFEAWFQDRNAMADILSFYHNDRWWVFRGEY